MPDEVIAQDAQVKRWLDEAFSVLAGPLGLPQGVVSVGRNMLWATPLDDLLRWAEALGLASGETTRRLAREIPSAAQKLGTAEGHQALLRWEESHEAAPVLKALGQAVEEIQAFWRGGGAPGRSAVRLLAVLAVGPVVPGAAALTARLATVMGAEGSDAVGLIREVARLVVADEGVRLEQADGVIRQEPFLARWLDELLSALEAAVLESGPRGASRSPLVESRLVSLLADLVRSAVAWEVEHGLSSDGEGRDDQPVSPGVPRARTLPPSGSLQRLKLVTGGEHNGVPDDNEGEPP